MSSFAENLLSLLYSYNMSKVNMLYANILVVYILLKKGDGFIC